MNYSGPNVEITLKDVANEPVVALTAFFTSLFSYDYDFNFDVCLSNPLLPGSSVNSTEVLMDGFRSASYSLTITGTLHNGTTFSYLKRVKIVEPTY